MFHSLYEFFSTAVKLTTLSKTSKYACVLMKSY